MNPGLVLIALGALVGGVVAFWLRRRTPSSSPIQIDEISEVLAALSASKSYPAFAVFMFDASNEQSTSVNLQFALENGKPGFEWVLLAPQNIKDRHLFQDFARANGYAAEAKEMNGVRYL